MIYVLSNARGETCGPKYIRHWYFFLLIHHTEFSKNLDTHIPKNEEVKAFKYYATVRDRQSDT